jgi:hypothetical protein
LQQEPRKFRIRPVAAVRGCQIDWCREWS